MSLAQGTTLGPYVVVERLGVGGMGEVYRARDPRLGRDVAIKLLPPRHSGDPAARTRFRHETQALAALSHPNILEVFDVGVEDGRVYAVMELLQGETLGQRLRRGPLTWRETAEICATVAEGLAAAHGKGVIHRDLKPDNIFLTGDGRVKILDFGLAGRTGRGAWADGRVDPGPAEPPNVAGTLEYMSPEQVRGDVADHRSDLFSLGAVMYEMLTGVQAFQGDTVATLATAILHHDPDLSRVDKGVPQDMVRLLRHCLSKAPGERVGSAERIMVILRSLETASRLERARVLQGLWFPRRLLVLVLAGVLLLAAAAAFLMTGRSRVRSVAVVPFVNESGDPSLAYLGDGLADSLEERLTRLDAARVASGMEVRRVRIKNPDPMTVGQELGVEAVVVGAVRWIQGRLRVDIEVVRTRDGSRLGGARVMDVHGSLHDLEDQILAVVTEAFGIPPSRRLPDLPPGDVSTVPGAYDAYLKGRHLWRQRREHSMRRAQEHFQRAVELDPGFARAHAGLADTYGLMVNYGYLSPREGWPASVAAANRALELAPGLSDAHAILGSAACSFYWDWSACERSLTRALELNPTNTTARQWLVQYLVGTGRAGAGLEELMKARRTEPTSAILVAVECAVHTYAGNPARGEPLCREALELEPGLPPARYFLALSLREQGRLDEAAAVLKGDGVLDRPGDWISAEYGFVLARTGDHAAARQILADLRAAAGQRYVSPYFEAIVLAGMEAKDEAFAALDRALADRATHLVTIQVDPAMNPLRDDPRFGLLLRRMNFPAASPGS